MTSLPMIRTLLRAAAATAAVISATTPSFAAAQPLGIAQLDTILGAEKENVARFKRDYVGQQFTATVTFAGSHLQVNQNFWLDFGKLECAEVRPNSTSAAQAANWDVNKTTVTIAGTIQGTWFGALVLENCRIDEAAPQQLGARPPAPVDAVKDGFGEYVLLGVYRIMGETVPRDMAKEVGARGPSAPTYHTKKECEQARDYVIQKYAGKSHAEGNYGLYLCSELSEWKS